MSPPRHSSRKSSTRQFTTAVLLLASLAAYAYISHVVFKSAAPEPGLGLASRDLDVLSKKNRECRQVHHAKDKCKYVRKYCADENAGLIPYLSLYYCDLGNAQPLALIILIAWTGILFSTIGIAASDFFSVNLSTIASILGLSESLAGVTFLAFGNGSPDVFSTFAAMGSNSASMAVGELIGAAGFITAVVAGSMALVREFKVSKKTYLRDICFFLVAATFTFALLVDGNLRAWECASMIGFYIFYVVAVVGWHWYTTRQKSRRSREAASRSDFFGPGGDVEPYRDDEDEDEDRTAGQSRNPNEATDIRALEEGPRNDLGDEEEEDRDVYQERGMHVAAEMASSMRVMRPRGRRSTTTITPIRPSLVGALEFRSVLSSLQRERNMRLRPIQPGHGRSYSVNYLGTDREPTQPRSADQSRRSSLNPPDIHTESVTRDRALSSGDVPLGLGNNIANYTDTAIDSGSTSPLILPQVADRARARSPSPAAAYKVGGKLAPPPTGSGAQSPRLQLEIPSRSPPSSEASSPALSPFPALMESPMAMSPVIAAQTPPQIALPSPSIEPGSGIDTPVSPKPVKWWPYNILPPPHILTNTMFPTLQGWADKTIWDKFVSLISVPSIFCLVVTLPVVETDSCDGGSGDDADDDRLGEPVPPVSTEPRAAVRPETEWQEYRRSTRTHSGDSHGSHYNSHLPSPLLISIESPHESRLQGALGAGTAANGADAPANQSQSHKPSGPGSESSCGGGHDLGWNRWLVALQIFTGPLFVVLIVWANMQEELNRPHKVLFRLVLYSLLVSLVLLAILFLTTSPHRRPRFHYLLCFLGFIISVAWISTVAGEVVGVLKAFGVILSISEAVLGLTIFAVGNSLGDLVANVTVARLGYPVMALSACFGGPMLNILIGIGLGGLFYKNGLHIEVGGTLIVSAISLLVTLSALLVVVPCNKWILTRKIGWGLIGLWTVSTILNLIIEASGIWRDTE